VPDTKRDKILIVEDEDDLRRVMQLQLEADGYEVIAVPDGAAGVEAARTASPGMVLLDVMMPGMDGHEVLRRLRSSYRTRYLPVILVTAKSQLKDRIEGLEAGANDIVVKPYVPTELLLRVRILLKWTQGVRDINPLTGLPGNASIEREVNRRLERGQSFGFLYADANGFKAFNDTYGYVRGDQAIRAMADALGGSLEALGRQSTFLGHVGGDDFVVITTADMVETIGEAMIREFEARIPALYDAEDRERGFIEVLNRRDEMEKFGLLTLTVAGLSTEQVRITHYAELSDRIAELKRHGKTHMKSTLVTERRRAEETATRLAG
jgi:DNA-binding response OmpR family regulator